MPAAIDRAPSGKLLLTIKETAAALSCSRATLYARLIDTGRLRPVQGIDARPRFLASEVAALVEELAAERDESTPVRRVALEAGLRRRARQKP